MGTMTTGALIGGAVDKLAGGDDPGEGALVGGATAEVLKLVLPIVVTYTVGWAALRGLVAVRAALATGAEA